MDDEILEKLSGLIEARLQKSEKKMLDFTEASEYLGLSKSFLYKLSHFRKIPFYKPNGKKIYFSKSNI